MNANRVVPFDRVLEEVWGRQQPEAGVRALRYQVSKLRDSLEPGRESGVGGVIGTERGGYVVRVDDGEVDAHRFERLAADGARALADGRFSAARSRLDEALGMWRGGAYEDFRYEGFAQGEITRLEEARLVCLENRISADLELGRHRDVVAELRELTTHYPLREGLWGQLMVALYRTGQQSEALRAYQTARRVLGDELGIAPTTALQRLEEQILLHELPIEAPAVEPPHRDQLPARVDSLIGRTEDLRNVEKLIGRHRLVTLTGFGGVGKTSLALEVARTVAAGYPDGVSLVELAPVTDPVYVAGEIASAVGVQDHPTRPLLDVMIGELAPRELLLVVDNCEHLVDEAGRVISALLDRCPSLRVLTTSREPLRVAGEQVWPVPPLDLPDRGAAPSLDTARRSDAVTLLVERAQQAHPGFELVEGNVGDVVSLCRRLDGIPLALELAAARLRLLSPAEMLHRLDDRFALLTAQRPRPGRHRSLGAAIEWSYGLLKEPDQVLLRRLGVFEGGFTLAAAEAVCSGDGIETGRVLDGLGRLVDASLVTVTSGEPRRFGMLESVHEFAQAALADSAEEQDVRARHAEYHVALISEKPDYDSLVGAETLRLLETERDNYRSALAWAVAADDGDRALALADRLRLLHNDRRDHALHWFPRVLEMSKSSPTAERVRVLSAFAHVLAYSPRRPEVLPIMEELATLTARLDDEVLTAWTSLVEIMYLEADSRPKEADWVLVPHIERLRRLRHPMLPLFLSNLTWGLTLVGDYEQASRLIEEQERIGHELRQPMTRALATFHRGMLAHYDGDLYTAEQLLLESLGRLRRLNRPGEFDNPLHQLARVAIASGAFGKAATWANELIDVGYRMLNARNMADGYVLLARAELGRDDIAAAADAAGEALRIVVEADDAWALALLAATTGQLARATRDPVGAAVLHGAAETMRAHIGFVHPKPRDEELEREFSLLRETLGADGFRDAWQRGSETDRARLVDAVRDVLISAGA